ncbi:hypothetical protein D3C87_1833430 [compost metagenome]
MGIDHVNGERERARLGWRAPERAFEGIDHQRIPRKGCSVRRRHAVALRAFVGEVRELFGLVVVVLVNQRAGGVR